MQIERHELAALIDAGSLLGIPLRLRTLSRINTTSVPRQVNRGSSAGGAGIDNQ
jgi:hypothetical protein